MPLILEAVLSYVPQYGRSNADVRQYSAHTIWDNEVVLVLLRELGSTCVLVLLKELGSTRVLVLLKEVKVSLLNELGSARVLVLLLEELGSAWVLVLLREAEVALLNELGSTWVLVLLKELGVRELMLLVEHGPQSTKAPAKYGAPMDHAPEGLVVFGVLHSAIQVDGIWWT